jgi:hypothetical protein
MMFQRWRPRMHRAVSSIAAVLISLLVLSGCVGIPLSGPVETGPLIGDQGDPELVLLPSGPTPGAEPQELLRDFLLAMRGPQGDYAVARQFLTPAIAETWDPDVAATIRQGPESIIAGSGENTLRYTITSGAYVDADWRYFETPPVTTTLDFSFSRAGGEWRISKAPNGIVLSESSFNLVFRERALYFFDPSYTYLVPDVRWFPSRSTVAVRIGSALVAGPTSWLAPGVLTAFPEATTVNSVTVTSGVATVELSGEALGAIPEDRVRMRQQFAATLDVTTVIMTVGGLDLVTPDAGVGPVRNPGVDPAVLLGTTSQFGFEADGEIAEIVGLSPKVAGAGATAATLSADRESVAFLAPDGVYIGRTGDAPALRVDARSDLTAPALDPFRFVWSAQASSATTLIAYGYDGTVHEVQSSFPADASVVSIDVSRDGTRLLASLLTPSGSRLYVTSIVRDQGMVPIGLGEEPQLLVSPPGIPVDATWVDDRRVASLTTNDRATVVSYIEIGGASGAIGEVVEGIAIVGGNRREGLRVLSAEGAVWRLQGTNWVDTEIIASFLGVKQ